MKIETDQSLLPTKDIVTQRIITIPYALRARQREPFKNRYIEIVFNKASTSTIYTRSFSKIDDYFSYVGGLVGTILLFFFILGNYSQKSYVINIASEIYNGLDDDDESSPRKEFNFFYYFCMLIKNLCQFIRLKFEWKEPDRFIGIMDEMEKQLNVTYLLRRINFF